MALTRKFLQGMGLTEEQVDAIVEEHADTVDSLKKQRDKYRDDAEHLDEVQEELDNLKKQVKDDSKDANEWKDKFEKKNKEFEAYKAEVEAKTTKEAVKEAYIKLLKAANVSEKHIPSIVNITNFDDMKLDKDGNVEGADKYTEAIKEKYSSFITTTGTEGSDVSTPPQGGATKYSSKKEIMEIKDASKRQEAIMNNPELFS